MVNKPMIMLMLLALCAIPVQAKKESPKSKETESKEPFKIDFATNILIGLHYQVRYIREIPKDEKDYLLAETNPSFNTLMLDLGIRFLRTEYFAIDFVIGAGVALNTHEVIRIYEK